MATRTQQARKPPSRPKQARRQEYEETPDYGTVFQRPDNDPPRPGFNGTGVLSAETLKAIEAAGGEFQIAVWTLRNDGKPLRTKDGLRRFRVHIEPPWEGDNDQEDDDYGDGADVSANNSPPDEDIPF